MPGGTTGFQTYQTVAYYEQALDRHAQYIRWTRALYCPCVSKQTRQPDANCTLCKGRGRIYKTPGIQHLTYEVARHDSFGKVYPAYTPVVGTPVVIRQGVELTLASSQPSDGSYIQLDPPYPKAWQEIFVTYDYNPEITVTDEDSTVYATNVLQTVETQITDKGKSFEGSVASVSEVRNVTRSEVLTVTGYRKDFIYLQDMGNWQSGDVLAVDYTYVQPFRFVIFGISEKIRYESAWVLEQADATLMTPYWAKPSPDDLFTVMAAEQYGSAIIDPTHASGNDTIRNFFDLARIVEVIDQNGTEYDPMTDVEVHERNEIKWNVTKPSRPYSIQFTYHPTYIALGNLSMLRTAENKTFINRISLMRYDHTSDEVQY